MFAVEIYAAVRRFVFIEGKSRREAARVFGLSRDTIAKMCRYSAPPGYVRSKAPERPKLGLLVPVIDAILESDKTAPPKQRHTAKRISERLRLEHRFAGGYTVVKDYVRIARSRSREVFVPLAHPPGQPSRARRTYGAPERRQACGALAQARADFAGCRRGRRRRGHRDQRRRGRVYRVPDQAPLLGEQSGRGVERRAATWRVPQALGQRGSPADRDRLF